MLWAYAPCLSQLSQINELSLAVAVLTVRAMNSHYRSMFSLPDQWFSLPVTVLTISKNSQCQINEFSLLIAVLTTTDNYWNRINELSLPIAALTTRSMNCRYRWLYSLPDQWILTTHRCSHWQIKEFSLQTTVLTTRSCNEFSLPIAVLTTRPMNSQYRWQFSLQINEFLLPSVVPLPDQWILTTERCSTTRSMNCHYQSLLSPPDPWILTTVVTLPMALFYSEYVSLPDKWILTTSGLYRMAVLPTRSMNSHHRGWGGRSAGGIDAAHYDDGEGTWVERVHLQLAGFIARPVRWIWKSQTILFENLSNSLVCSDHHTISGHSEAYF